MKIIPPLHAWITKILGLPTRVGQLLLSNSLKTLSSWSLRPSVPNINPSSPWLSRQTNEASPWRWAGSAAKISNFCAISYKNYIHETSKNIHATCHHNFKQDGYHNYIASSLWLHPSLGWGVVYVCAHAWVCFSFDLIPTRGHGVDILNYNTWWGQLHDKLTLWFLRRFDFF